MMEPSDKLTRTNGKNNPKNRNPEYLCPFEYAVTERVAQQINEC